MFSYNAENNPKYWISLIYLKIKIKQVKQKKEK